MKLDIQKASVLKRISAGILDFILVIVLAVGFAALISVISDFDGHISTFNNCRAEAAIQSGLHKYADDPVAIEDYANVNTCYDYYLSDAFKNLSEEEQKVYNDTYAATMEILQNNPTAVKENALVSSLTIVITSVGILLAYLILEFIIPLILKNGQTIGKKVFGIALMHTNCVKVSHTTMFIRTILGKYAIETMIPVIMLLMLFMGLIGWAGLVVFGGIIVLEIVCFLYKKQFTLIHDLLAKTYAIDLASQQIFDTAEEAIEAQRLAQYEEGADYVPGTFTFGKTTEGKDIKGSDQDTKGTDDIDDTCGTDDVVEITDETVDVDNASGDGVDNHQEVQTDDVPVDDAPSNEVDVAPLSSVGDADVKEEK